MLSCLISLFTAPTPASLNERRQRRQHMFVARLIRWRGLYSLSSLRTRPVSSVLIRRRLLSAQARLSEARSPPPVSSEAGLAAHNCDQQSDKQCLQCHDHIAISTLVLISRYCYFTATQITWRRSFLSVIHNLSISISDLLLQEFILRSNHQISPKKLDDLHPAALHF